MPWMWTHHPERLGLVLLLLMGAPMLMDAPTRAVYRAEEQMESGVWKIPDSDEADLPATCHVCDRPLVPRQIKWQDGRLAMRKPTKGTRLCPECIREGWRNASCVRCGSVTRTWNWSSKKRDDTTRGCCPKCREEMAAERELA